MPIWEPSLIAAGLEPGRRLDRRSTRSSRRCSTRRSCSTSGRSATSSRSRSRSSRTSPRSATCSWPPASPSSSSRASSACPATCDDEEAARIELPARRDQRRGDPACRRRSPDVARPSSGQLMARRPAWRPGLRRPLVDDPGRRGPRSPSAHPAPPVRPARAQRVVLGAVGRPAHLAVRRPDPPVRAGGARPRDDRLDGRRRRSSFFVAALPNLFLSPIAGTFVDRWDRKEVLIVSDILRAAVVLLIPVAVDRERAARLPADLRRHLDLALLPAGAGRDPAAARRRTTSS